MGGWGVGTNLLRIDPLGDSRKSGTRFGYLSRPLDEEQKVSAKWCLKKPRVPVGARGGRPGARRAALLSAAVNVLKR